MPTTQSLRCLLRTKTAVQNTKELAVSLCYYEWGTSFTISEGLLSNFLNLSAGSYY